MSLVQEGSSGTFVLWSSDLVDCREDPWIFLQHHCLLCPSRTMVGKTSLEGISPCRKETRCRLSLTCWTHDKNSKRRTKNFLKISVNTASQRVSRCHQRTWLKGRSLWGKFSRDCWTQSLRFQILGRYGHSSKNATTPSALTAEYQLPKLSLYRNFWLDINTLTS